jgi:hypothetical protein
MKEAYMDHMKTFSHLNKKLLVLLLQGSRGRPPMGLH